MAPAGTATRRAPRATPSSAPRTSGRLRAVSARALEERTRKRRARVMLVIAAALFTGALLAVVAGQAMVSSQQVRLANLNNQLTTVVQSNQDLQLTKAQLDAPGRILQIAEDKLHMVVPGQVHYLTPADPGPAVGAAS
jgi:cell division protein FtsB